MDNKLMVMILTALLVGLGIGYSLGHISQQLQIPALQNQVNTLNSQIYLLQAQLVTKDSQISNLEAQINNLTTQINNLQGQVTFLLSQIGSTGGFTTFERLEVTLAYADRTTTGYNIMIKVKNTGSAPATIEAIYINGKMCDLTSVNATSTTSTVTLGGTQYTLTFSGDILSKKTLNPGASITFYIATPYGGPFTTGVNLDISIQTSAGKVYPKVVPLP